MLGMLDPHKVHVLTLANSIIGVSLLAMPYCFKKCGIILSVVLLLFSSVMSRLACHFLLKSAIKARLRTFEHLAYHAFGSFGKLMIEIGIIGFLVGTCIAFFVVMGDLGPQIVSEMTDTPVTPTLRTSILMALALFCVLPLGLLRNVNSLSGVCTATIGFYLCLVLKIFAESAPHIFSGDWYDKVEFWRPDGILQCIPIFSIALFCQPQLFEVYQVVQNPSLEHMNHLIRLAVNICTSLYIFVGFFGYIAVSDRPFQGNILTSFQPSMVTETIKIGFVFSVVFSFPLVIFPCRVSLYSLLCRSGHSHEGGNNYIPEGQFKGLTFGIVLLSLVIGVVIPNIELVLGLIGSTIGVLICVIFPATCFICLSTKNTNERLVSQGMLFIGIVVMVLGTYANLYALEEATIVENAGKQSGFIDIAILKPRVYEVTTIGELPIKIAEAPIKEVLESKNVRHEPPQPEAPSDESKTKKKIANISLVREKSRENEVFKDDQSKGDTNKVENDENEVKHDGNKEKVDGNKVRDAESKVEENIIESLKSNEKKEREDLSKKNQEELEHKNLNLEENPDVPKPELEDSHLKSKVIETNIQEPPEPLPKVQEVNLKPEMQQPVIPSSREVNIGNVLQEMESKVHPGDVKISEEKLLKSEIAEGKLLRSEVSGEKLSEKQISEKKLSKPEVSEGKLSKTQISENEVIKVKISEEKKKEVMKAKISEEKDSKNKIPEEQLPKTDKSDIDAEAIKKEDKELLEQETDKVKEEVEKKLELINTLEKHNEEHKQLLEKHNELLDELKKKNEALVVDEKAKLTEEKLKAVKEIENIAKKAIESLVENAVETDKVKVREKENLVEKVQKEANLKVDEVKRIDVEKEEKKIEVGKEVKRIDVGKEDKKLGVEKEVKRIQAENEGNRIEVEKDGRKIKVEEIEQAEESKNFYEGKNLPKDFVPLPILALKNMTVGSLKGNDVKAKESMGEDKVKIEPSNQSVLNKVEDGKTSGDNAKAKEKIEEIVERGVNGENGEKSKVELKSEERVENGENESLKENGQDFEVKNGEKVEEDVGKENGRKEESAKDEESQKELEDAKEIRKDTL